MLLMTFQFMEACGITGVLSVFLGSLFVFVSMILTYSFRQVGLKKYLLIHGGFVAATLLISAGLYKSVQTPEAVQTCAQAPLKMLFWIPAVIALTLVTNFLVKKKARV